MILYYFKRITMQRLSTLLFLCVLIINTVANTMDESDFKQNALCEILGISKDASPEVILAAMTRLLRSEELNEKGIKFLKLTTKDYCSVCASQILTLNSPFVFTGKTSCCQTSINLCDGCCKNKAVRCPNTGCCESLDVTKDLGRIALNRVKKCSVCSTKVPDSTQLTLNPPFAGKTPCCKTSIDLCYSCKNLNNKTIQCPNSNCSTKLDVAKLTGLMTLRNFSRDK